MEELHSLDPRRQELLEARFTGAVSGNTGGSTGSMSGGAKVTAHRRKSCFSASHTVHTKLVNVGTVAAKRARQPFLCNLFII